MGIRAAISRNLTSPPFNRQIKIVHDLQFMSSNHVLTAMIKNLKREGKDVSIHKKPIAEGDIEKLYTSGVFNTDKPVTLQYKVFYDILFNFGRRGQEGIRDLKKSSYGKFKDDRGQEYHPIMYNECDKTHHGVDSRETSKEVRMYVNPNSNHCPVASLDLYLSKLSPKCDAFFSKTFTSSKS